MAEAPNEPTTPGLTGALFRVLVTGTRDPEQIYTATREVELMAGQSAVAQLTALIQATAAELKAENQATAADLKAENQATRAELAATKAELAGQIAATNVQLRRIWAFLFILLVAVIGMAGTLATVMRPTT